MENKTTLVIGASENSRRYSNMAVSLLLRYGHDVYAYGLREGKIGSVEIRTIFPDSKIDTVTMYVGPGRQANLIDPILKIKPKRVIFNPGTENDSFVNILITNGIEVVENCTLVMLNSGIY